MVWDDNSVAYWQQFGDKLEQRRRDAADPMVRQQDPSWQPPTGELWAGWWPATPIDDHPYAWMRSWDGQVWLDQPRGRLIALQHVAGDALLDWYLRWAVTARLDRRELVDARHDLAQLLVVLAFTIGPGTLAGSQYRPAQIDGGWRDGHIFVPNRRTRSLLAGAGLGTCTRRQRRRVQRLLQDHP